MQEVQYVPNSDVWGVEHTSLENPVTQNKDKIDWKCWRQRAFGVFRALPLRFRGGHPAASCAPLAPQDHSDQVLPQLRLPSSARAVSLRGAGIWLCRALVRNAGLGRGSPGVAVAESSSWGLSFLWALRGKSGQLWQAVRALQAESINSVKSFQSFGKPFPAPWLRLVSDLSTWGRVDPQGNGPALHRPWAGAGALEGVGSTFPGVFLEGEPGAYLGDSRWPKVQDLPYLSQAGQCRAVWARRWRVGSDSLESILSLASAVLWKKMKVRF